MATPTPTARTGDASSCTGPDNDPPLTNDTISEESNADLPGPVAGTENEMNKDEDNADLESESESSEATTTDSCDVSAPEGYMGDWYKILNGEARDPKGPTFDVDIEDPLLDIWWAAEAVGEHSQHIQNLRTFLHERVIDFVNQLSDYPDNFFSMSKKLLEVSKKAAVWEKELESLEQEMTERKDESRFSGCCG
ncbi:MAG: hypothetical protein Q9202_006812 [Teloschistes flavicans]